MFVELPNGVWYDPIAKQFIKCVTVCVGAMKSTYLCTNSGDDESLCRFDGDVRSELAALLNAELARHENATAKGLINEAELLRAANRVWDRPL